MSAFILLRLADSVVILTDGAVYPGYHDFTVTGYANKVWSFPHLDMAVAWRGTSDLAGLLLYKHANNWRTFDDFLENIVDHAEQERDRFDDLWPGRAGACELGFGGWSEARQRFETYSFFITTEEAIGAPEPCQQLYMAPCPEAQYLAGVGFPDGNIAIGSIDQLQLLMQAQRDSPHFMGHPGEDADDAAKGHCVGAFIQQTTVRRGLIQSEIVKRWPDQIGKLIDPARV